VFPIGKDGRKRKIIRREIGVWDELPERVLHSDPTEEFSRELLCSPNIKVEQFYGHKLDVRVPFYKL